MSIKIHFNLLVAVLCFCLLRTPAEILADGPAGGAGLADQYLLKYAELEDEVLGEFACVVSGKSVSAYPSTAQFVERDDLFLLAQSKSRKLDYFCSGTLVSRLGTPASRWEWDESLHDNNGSYHRYGFDMGSTTTWKISHDAARFTPRFSPFALAISTRMGWMAGCAKTGFLDSLCDGNSEIYKTFFTKEADLVGLWVLNSPGCVVKITFGHEVDNLPIAVDWYTLINSKSAESTVESGIIESSSAVVWRKHGDRYLPVYVKKIDNGHQRKLMSEEWEIKFEWRIGVDSTDSFPKDYKGDLRMEFKDFDLFKESHIATLEGGTNAPQE